MEPHVKQVCLAPVHSETSDIKDDTIFHLQNVTLPQKCFYINSLSSDSRMASTTNVLRVKLPIKLKDHT